MGNVKAHVTNSLSSLGDRLSGGISSFFDKFVDFFEWIKDKFVSFKDFISGFFDWVKDRFDVVKNKVTSWWNTVYDWITNFFDNIGNLLKDMFVPTYSPVDEIKAKINERFSFISQMVDLSADLFTDFGSTSVPPSFTITLYGQSYDIINFSIMQPYRATIHSIIIAIAWINFALWFFKFSPRLIKGGG